VVLEVEEDIYVHAFRPLSPNGTHHAVLFIVDALVPAGESDCDGLTAGSFMLYGSGIGTGDLVFPDGVAVVIESGTKILLNLHLFNTGVDELQGTSGIEVLTVPQEVVTNRAQMVLMGKDQGLVVPSGESTSTGRCPVPGNATLFALFPHMHQTGQHMKVQLNDTTTTTVLMDADYSFHQQLFTTVTPSLQLVQGDTIRVDCTYSNPGAQKSFGDSSTDEMCYTGVYVFPAIFEGITCTD
jgi:hypothetical protein